MSKPSKKRTTIAIIIPTYNYGMYLRDAIKSALKQTRQVEEILIADDCSQDNTAMIALKFTRRYPRLIRYQRNTKNLGIVDNLNKAIASADGDYICCLSADDKLRNDYIEKTAGVLDADRRVGIAYTDVALFGPRAKAVYFEFPEILRGEIGDNFYVINFPDYNGETKKILAKQNFIHGGSLFRKKIHQEIGGYKKTNIAEDHDFALRVVRNGWLAKRVSYPIYFYRQHFKMQRNIKTRKFYSGLFVRNRHLFSPIINLLSHFNKNFKYY